MFAWLWALTPVTWLLALGQQAWPVFRYRPPPEHPPLMFCEETVHRFRAGERSPTSLEFERHAGRTFNYDVMRDTIQWGDESDVAACSHCTEIWILLIHHRSVLWGTNAPSEFDNPALWANVLRQCPEWPGFQRLQKPEWHDAYRAQGRIDYEGFFACLGAD